MSESVSESLGSSSRLVRWLGIPLAAILLTLFFVYLGFPYDRLTRYALRGVDQNQGLQVLVGSASPSVAWLGPGIALRDVVIVPSNNPRIHLDRVELRPAWSFSWFRAVPAVHASIEAPSGDIDATVQLENPLRLTGTFTLVDARELPLPERTPEIPLRGEVKIEFDVSGSLDNSGGPWEGTLKLTSEGGSVAFSGFPVAIPYDELESLVRLGGDQLLAIEVGRMDGPLVSATLSGSIRGERLDPAGVLDLELITQSNDESVHKAMRDLGFDVDGGGQANLRLEGTLAKPLLR